jgi:tRNA-uridine 2-sulfurtransferase
MRALAVFSGGLDSMLSVRLIQSQGIEVQGLFYETPFFPSVRARASAASIDLPLKIIDVTKVHLEIVKSPRHGHGANMNPCIDCHTMMLSEAGKMLEKEDAGFLFTGEVLGQRPLSQKKRALALVASESGFEGLIVRPLSAKLLPPTLPELNGWIDREGLLAISGRSRKTQMGLAARFGIRDYPAPAGGCLLTDVIFSRRLKDLFGSRPNAAVREIELLKLGRHFRVTPETKLVVGRNQKENERIETLSEGADLLARTVSVPGPVVLAVGEISPEIEELVADMTVSYSDARGKEAIPVRLVRKEEEAVRSAAPLPRERFRKYMIE